MVGLSTLVKQRRTRPSRGLPSFDSTISNYGDSNLTTTTETTTKTGKIIRLVIERGFGFIQPDATPDDSRASVFFHRSACLTFDALADGDRVTYVETASQKGPRGENVQLVSATASA
jgi:cold shock CspA family protein